MSPAQAALEKEGPLMTLVKTDGPRPIDVVIDYFGVTRRAGAGLRPAFIAPVRRVGGVR
jgi:hypothetical protein